MAEDQPPEPDVNPSADANPDSPNDTLAAALGGEAGEPSMDQATIDEILKQASFEDVADAVSPPSSPAPESAHAEEAVGVAEPRQAAPALSLATEDFQLPSFHQAIQDAAVSSIDLLRDVDLNVKIELGRSRMLVEDVLKLGEGSVVELDKLAGDPVDVFVNERLVARGEVLVLNDNFCVRINEIVAVGKEEGL
jgi:flagellar motor switch protein FliN/FliY